ncbi:MAG: AmmeMemoRadiSam system protein B [Anaerolineae bacterium CG2_30_64_16]|nr:MAG: AmmeMemoRadiSam system protein B [Anaerolineae bacterium CG2_30_64_16]
MADIRPKLRSLDVRPVAVSGRPALLLRDPLQLSEGNVVVPHEVAPLLALSDGTRDSAALSAALLVRFGLRADTGLIDKLMTALDEAFLLDNARFREARAQALTAYRAASFRVPALAGASYPAEPTALRQLFQGYLDDVRATSAPAPAAVAGRGLISPHIDYARGGPVYAAVWDQAAEMVQAADLVILLGTDHFGGPGALTLTRQHYATPLGILPTAQDAVAALANAIGEEAAFGEELHHRSEHAIELAAVWLHFVRDGRPCETLPILCGSFDHFIQGQAAPEADATIERLMKVLRGIMAGRQAVVIAAGDLAHVGPAFGGHPLDALGKARLRAADQSLIRDVCAGDPEAFLDGIRQVGDRYNVCGVPPIYLALRLLEPTHGRLVSYAQCPADELATSVVSVCGIVWEA